MILALSSSQTWSRTVSWLLYIAPGTLQQHEMLPESTGLAAWSRFCLWEGLRNLHEFTGYQIVSAKQVENHSHWVQMLTGFQKPHSEFDSFYRGWTETWYETWTGLKRSLLQTLDIVGLSSVTPFMDARGEAVSACAGRTWIDNWMGIMSSNLSGDSLGFPKNCKPYEQSSCISWDG